MPLNEDQPDLPAAAEGSAITVIGESLVDIINDPRRSGAGSTAYPGGSPLNVAVGCSRLGLRTSLVTDYAEDPHGRMIAEHLQDNGVEVIVAGSSPTSAAVAVLDTDGAAQYTFSITWDIAGTSVPAQAAVGNSVHVHAGSIAAVLPPGNRAVRGLIDAARAHATVSYDPNCRPAITSDTAAAREQAEDFVAASDIVKASDEDLRWLYPDRSQDEAMAAWLELGPGLVALTRGAEGLVLLTRTDRIEMPAAAATVVDSVGAGDSFMAGLISGLAQLKALGASARSRLHELTADDLRALAAYANKAAAITCSRQGANPPRLDELGPLVVLSSTLEG